MPKETIFSAFYEFIASLRYLVESKRKKLSLKTYMDIMGEKIDECIITAKKEENLTYVKGSCRIEASEYNNEKISFSATLFFTNKEGTIIKKDMSKDVSSSTFTTEALQMIAKEKSLKFDIDAPGGTVL